MTDDEGRRAAEAECGRLIVVARQDGIDLLCVAGEVALEAIRHRNRDVVRESADLLYHLTVLWRRAGIEPSEVWAEMHQRAAATGIAEKLPKTVRQTE